MLELRSTDFFLESEFRRFRFFDKISSSLKFTTPLSDQFKWYFYTIYVIWIQSYKE